MLTDSLAPRISPNGMIDCMKVAAPWILAVSLVSFNLMGAIQSGPEVGSPMPAFEAPDQNGKVQSLKSLLGPKGAVIVFYRSADW